MSKLHKFVLVKTHDIPEQRFDTVVEAFKAPMDPSVDRVYVTYEPTGLRVRVLRP